MLLKFLKTLVLRFGILGAFVIGLSPHEAELRIRIRVSRQKIGADTCLMAGRSRPDTCLVTDSYVSHGRPELSGYVSHGRFLRVSWQNYFPKSMIYKVFQILQNTKTVVTQTTTKDYVQNQVVVVFNELVIGF